MKTLSTTKMSSKGQVVIPEEIRNRLGLSTGAQFIVVADNDVVIMKTITQPSMKEFNPLIKKARKQAKSAGMTRDDISSTLAEIRAGK